MAVFLQPFDQKVPCYHRIKNLSLCLQDMSFSTLTFHILAADFCNIHSDILPSNFQFSKTFSLSAFPPCQFHLQNSCLKLYFKTTFQCKPVSVKWPLNLFFPINNFIRISCFPHTYQYVLLV